MSYPHFCIFAYNPVDKDKVFMGNRVPYATTNINDAKYYLSLKAAQEDMEVYKKMWNHLERWDILQVQ